MSSKRKNPGATPAFSTGLWIAIGLASVAFPQGVLAECTPGNIGTEGPDQILCDADNNAEGADVSSLGGNDTLDLNGGTIGTLDAGAGDDQVNIDGAIVETNLLTGDGNDTVIMNNRDSEVGGFLGGGMDTGAGNDRVEIYDGIVFELLTGDGDDDVILDGGFIFNFLDTGSGDDYIYWDEGIVSLINAGDGSDYLEIDAYAYEGDATFDGGDDLDADDGYIDTLRFKLDHRIDGGLLQNWEHIIINGSSKIELSGALAVGGGTVGRQRLGLDIRFGGVLAFTPENYTISGDVVNAGTLWLQDDRFNTLNIAQHSNGRYGDYTGRDGRLWIDTELGSDNSPTDLLNIEGDARGHTSVRVYNRNGTGAQTSGDGIQIITISGNSPRDAFALDGEYIGQDGRRATVGGAYGYTLHHGGLSESSINDGNWYLRSVLPDPFDGSGQLLPRWQPGAVLYETYPQAIRRMNQPTTLRKRVGNRFWAGTSFKDRGICCYGNAVERTIDGGGLWMRLTSEYNDNVPDDSTTRAEWQQDFGQVQVGADFSFDPAVHRGRLILGVFGQYAYGSTELDSFFGHGDIDTENFGIGTTLTWYGSQGSYADLQMQFNWFDSDLYSHELHYLGTGNDAMGFNFSVEAGHSFKLCDFFSLTPQVQVAYIAEDIDDNFDQYGVTFTDAENEASFARLGLAFEQRLSQRINRNMYGNLLLERIGLYAIANTFYYFDDETDVNISGTRLYQARDEWWGQVGVGATYDQCGDRCSVYGEVDYASSLDNFGDSDSVQFTIGFRFKW
ncbi:autotransporter outer membrane beta-barrel domain-containing protein [Microbulbifer sp. CAU 1566]|uniref:autotransporter family protein n=1 Tax=Microbulbifer sp. CAU 1566 TaxID=2933269 RepID=UPI0020041F98|nr:autotransporter outer membrane beta-barrel domain-containing protein [Microbulbifer sp. CAU 1566]MCK7596206.1 autotransporter outer membrane beta-barrel domain-containing protein [Microbulbifer sp. CAU 1566]